MTPRKATVKRPALELTPVSLREASLSPSGPDVIGDLFRKDSSTSQASARLLDIEGAVKHVFSAENIELKSNLKRTQIVKLVRLAVWEAEYKSGIGAYVLAYLLKLSVSIEGGKGGGGRQDLRTVLQSILNAERTPDATQANMNKLLGRG